MRYRCCMCGTKNLSSKKAFEEHMQSEHNIDWDNLPDDEVADLLVKIDNCRTSLEEWNIK